LTLKIRGRIIEDGEFRHARCIYSHVRYTVRTMSKIIHPKRLPNPTLHTTLPEIPGIQLLCLVRRRSIIGVGTHRHCVGQLLRNLLYMAIYGAGSGSQVIAEIVSCSGILCSPA
jgi:hypothetical protein